MCEIADMPEPGDRSLFARLMALKPKDLSANAWTQAAGVSRNFFNDVRKRGNANHDSLVKVLDAIGVNFADFETANSIVRSEVRRTGMTAADIRSAQDVTNARMIPLLGTAFGGDWEDEIELTELHLSEVLDNLPRPQSVATDEEAYVIEIIGDSMHPRYKPRELAVVSPKAPVRAGDDVIVQLTDPDAGGDLQRRVTMVLIKELVRRTSTYVELRQYNPERTFRVPAERVRRLHRVLDRLV